jgi:hypothetical protein
MKNTICRAMENLKMTETANSMQLQYNVWLKPIPQPPDDGFVRVLVFDNKKKKAKVIKRVK